MRVLVVIGEQKAAAHDALVERLQEEGHEVRIVEQPRGWFHPPDIEKIVEQHRRPPWA